MAFGSYEVGVIQRTPVPDLANESGERLGELALECVELKRDLDTANETSHVFKMPALLQVEGDTVATWLLSWTERVTRAGEALDANQREIDDIAFQLYGIEGDDRRAMQGALAAPPDAETDEAASDDDDAEAGESEALGALDGAALAASVVSWVVGVAFGRFDVRVATGERALAALPDPFAPLPTRSPGMMRPNDAASGAFARAEWGVLTDEPRDTSHAAADTDLTARVRAVFERVWGPRAEGIEAELCALLGARELRDYFARAGKGGFFDDHLKRYSKSRRKAPIWWPLQSKARHFTLWVSYHDFDGDLLWKLLLQRLESPKIAFEERRLQELQNQLAAQKEAGALPKTLRALERDGEKQEAILADLRDLRDKLRRAADLGIVPDHNDGVLLNIAPLWEMVPWKEAQKTWEELLAGKYEWSSVARQLREKGLVKTSG